MSESRIPNPSTPSKPSRSRKRSVKAAQPRATAEPQSTLEPPSSAPATHMPLNLSVIHRDAMIATAAYFRAQRRNFEAGHELEDWVAAEAEIDAALLEGRLQS